MKINRKSKLVIIILTILVLATRISLSASPNHEQKDSAILSAAENLFIHMINKEYVGIWNCLSLKSKQIIVNDVCKESKKFGIVYKQDELMNDFSSGNMLAKAYWDSFLNVFDPQMALEQCTWNIGEVKNNKAEVVLKHKKSDRPAIVKMYKENNTWKTGLKESFGTRSLSPFEKR